VSDATTAVAPVRLDLGAYVTSAVFVADGALAVALGDGTVRLIAPDGAERARAAVNPTGAVLSLERDPAGDGVIAGGDDGRVTRIGLDGAAAEIAQLKGKWIERIVAHARSGAFAVAVGKDMVLFRGGEQRTIGPHATTVTDIGFSPDGSRLAAAHYNGVSIWTVRTPSDRPRVLSWKGSHLVLRYSPNAKFLATTTQENAIHVWRLADGHDMQMRGYPAKIRSLAWSADSLLLLSSATEMFTAWSFAGKGPEGQPPLEFGEPGEALIAQVATHPRDGYAAAAYETGEVDLADLKTRRVVRLAGPDRAPATALAWSAEGSRLAVGSETGGLRIFDLSARAG